MKTRVGVGLLLLVSLLLSGCSGPSSEALWQDYQNRLSRALEVDREEVAAQRPLSAWPSRQERELAAEPIRLGLLEAYGMRACPDLLTRVAERNSQLGRVMLPSQQWLYELRLAHTLNACVEGNSNSLDESTFAELQSLQQRVQERLPRNYWNFLVNSEAMQGLFSLSGGRLKPDDQPPTQEIAGLLERLLEASQMLAAGDLPDYPKQLEQELRLLNNQASLSQLLFALQEANRYFTAVNKQLQARLGDQPLCRRPTPELPRAQVSRNLLYNVFMVDVQPWVAHLDRQSQQLIPIANALYQQPLAPASVEAYRQQWLAPENPDTPWQRFQQLNREHANHWQALLEQCGMAPGRS